MRSLEITPLSCSAALTHHWLVRPRGGEKVLEALAELVPAAPLHTLVYDRGGMDGSPLNERDVSTSFLQRIPGATRQYPRLLPLLPTAARSMRLPDVDLVLCSDAAMAKAMRASAGSTVVCYCHSPMRYAYEEDLHRAYRDSLPPVLRPIFGPAVAHARRVDRAAADRVDVFIANSAHVAERIRRAYDRRAEVVHPPVDVPSEPVLGPRDDYYVSVGFHTPYKRLDLAIEACRELGRRLVVIGTGPDVDRLRHDRPAHVALLGWQSDATVQEHLSRARGLLFPGEEDFGMVPVEAFARGCPVIAYGVGGATESVKRDVCGVWFERQTADELALAMRRAEQLAFDPVAMHRESLRFERSRFHDEVLSVIHRAMSGDLRS